MSSPNMADDADTSTLLTDSNSAARRKSWKTAAIKLKIGDHVRRIPVSRLLEDGKQDPPCLSKLRALTLSFYGENTGVTSTTTAVAEEEEYQVVFTYLDEEGETIYLSSEVELSEALEFSCSDDDSGVNLNMSGSGEEKPRVQFLRVTAEVTPLSSILEQSFSAKKQSPSLSAPPPTIERTESTEETVFRQAVESRHFKEEVIQTGATAALPPTVILGHQATAKEDDHSKNQQSAEKAKEDCKPDASATVTKLLDKAEEMMTIIRKEVEEVAASVPPLETIRPPPCVRKLQRKFSQAKRDQYQREREHLKPYNPPAGNSCNGVGTQFDPRFVHPRHQCDMCNVLPIRGFRWRAVRPKTRVEGAGDKAGETKKIDFVEMNFDLCHRCYVGFREQKDDEAGARAANRFSSMRKMQLPEGVKFHPVQLELDRLFHLRRHQRQEHLRNQGKSVHFDGFLREMANKSTFVAQTCIKTFNLPEHCSRRREQHINLIHHPKVNEGILKSLSQLSHQREESAKLAAAAMSPPAFLLDDGNTVVATVVSSLDLGDHAADQCALVEVVANHNHNVENSFSTTATSPPPVANVDMVTSRSVVDDPSVMTGDCDDTVDADIDEATEILPSVASEETTSQQQNEVEADDGECFLDSNEEHTDVELEASAPELQLSLASSYTLGSSSVTLQQSKSDEGAVVTTSSSLSLYLSAMEVVGTTPLSSKDGSHDILNVPVIEEDKEVVVALEAKPEVVEEEKELVVALETELEVVALEEKEEEEIALEDEVVEAKQEHAVVSQAAEEDEDSLFLVEEEDGESSASMSFVESSSSMSFAAVECVGDALSVDEAESVASSVNENEESAEDAWLLDESDGEQASVTDDGDLCESEDDVLSASDAEEEGEEVVKKGERELCDLSDGGSDDSSTSEWDLVDDEEIFARATQSIGSSLFSQGSK